MTSTIELESSCGFRSSSAFSGTAARSSARTDLSDPLTARPMGVRTASTITASGMWGSSPWSESTIGRRRREPARRAAMTRDAETQILRDRIDQARCGAAARLQIQAADAQLIEADMVGQLVTNGACHLPAQEFSVVPKVAAQRVAEDHDAIVGVVAT